MAVTHAQTTVSTTAVALGRVASNEALTVQNNSVDAHVEFDRIGSRDEYVQ